MDLDIRHIPASQLSEKQLKDVITLAAEVFTGDFEASIRKDLASGMEIITVYRAEVLFAFHTFKFLDFEVDGTKYRGIYDGDLITKKNKPKIASLLFTEILKVYHKEQQRCGLRLFDLLPLAGTQMYSCLDDLYRVYYPNPLHGIPVHDKRILDALAGKIFGKNYDPVKGLISYTDNQYSLKKAPESQHLAKTENPSSLFYLKLNPDFENGTDLACIAEITRENIMLDISDKND